jgi:hypothetical protein
MIQSDLEQLTKTFYKEGALLSGASINIDLNSLQVTISSGQIYASGYIHDVPSQTLRIKGEGEEVIGLLINVSVVTEVEDASLLDPAVGSENYGYSGAHRMVFTYQYAVNNPQSVPVYTLYNGRIDSTTSVQRPYIDSIMDILAQRTYEESGSYIVDNPDITVVNLAPSEVNHDDFFHLTIKGGLGYCKGYRVQNANATLSLDRALETATYSSEPFTFTTSSKVFKVDWTPIRKVSDILATVRTGTILMTRGTGDLDAIPAQYTPVVTIVSLNQGSSNFTFGADFVLDGANIRWMSGNRPQQGMQYSMVLDRTVHLSKGIRVLKTAIKGVTVTDNKASLNTIDINEVINLYVDQDKQNISYSLDKGTGVLSFPNPIQSGSSITVEYSYWDHTVEGDYLARDSFIDESGAILYYNFPEKLLDSKTDVDYKKHISFDTSGLKPVVNSTFYITYDYALPRQDVLIWNIKGRLDILKGNSSLIPSAPTTSEDELPIIKFTIPAEGWAEDVTIERYGNQRMTMVDLRYMLSDIKDLQYNQAIFQLHQESINSLVATDKRGVFADPLSSPEFANITHTDFKGTFDLLSREFSLPQIVEQHYLPVESSTAQQIKDYYCIPYAEEFILGQPYNSEVVPVNRFGGVNTAAEIYLDPPVDYWVEQKNDIVITKRDIINLPPHSLRNRNTILQLGPKVWWADNQGVKNERTGSYLDKTLFKRSPKQDWVDASSNKIGNQVASVALPSVSVLGVGTLSRWGTITQNMETTLLPYARSITVTVSSTSFMPNERYIQLLFDGQVLALTGVNNTPNETSKNFSHAVKADASGRFTATFVIPEQTKTGAHKVEVLGYTFDTTSNKWIVGSYASSVYHSETVLEETTNYVTAHVVKRRPSLNRAALAAAAILSIPVTTSMLAATSLVGLIAAAITTAVVSGFVITAPVVSGVIAAVALSAGVFLAAGVADAIATDVMKTVQNVKTIPDNQGSAISTSTVATESASSTATSSLSLNIVNAITTSATTLNAQVLTTAVISTVEIEPLAETFTLASDRFLTSIDLFFAQKPLDQNEVVEVVIAESINGVPSNIYLTSKKLNSSQINVSDAGNVPTKFVFNKPAYCKANKEYAILIRCDSQQYSVHISRVGSQDKQLGLITKNPATGTLLRSPNGSSWEVDGAADLKFNLYSALFNTTQPAIVNYGKVSFTNPKSRFTVSLPYAEPSDTTNISLQYALGDTSPGSWIDFPPDIEFNVEQLVQSIWLRAVLTGDKYLSPTLTTYAWINAESWLNIGAYISRQMILPHADARYVHVYFSAYIPGGTSVSSVQLDKSQDGSFSSSDLITEVREDRVDIGDGWIEYHYQYDNKSNTLEKIMVKINMTSTNTAFSPLIKNIRIIATAD